MVLAHASGYPKHLENDPNRNGFAQRGGAFLMHGWLPLE